MRFVVVDFAEDEVDREHDVERELDWADLWDGMWEQVGKI